MWGKCATNWPKVMLHQEFRLMVWVLGKDIRRHALENLKMTVLPYDLGSPVTKFKKMQEHLWMGDGCSRPRGWALCFLIWSYTDTNAQTSSCMLGIQNHLCLCIKVLVTPRCHERIDACPHCNTSDHTGLGRKRWPYEPLAGLSCGHCSSVSHWTPASAPGLGMMDSGLPSTSGQLNCLKRAQNS